MLKSITCNHDTFKTVNFNSGLNIVVADKTKASAQRGTRNGSGKTTLLEIIHHCLGAKKPSGDFTLAHPSMLGWEFTLKFTLSGNDVAVTRAVGSDDVYFTGLLNGSIHDKFKFDRDKWTEILGSHFFGITNGELDSSPTFRQVIRYFARLGSDAMTIAFETVRKQDAQEVRYINTFLLRLNWALAKKMKDAFEQQGIISKANKAVNTGVFEKEHVELSKMQAEEVELESEIELATEELRNFRVHRQYSEIEKEASELTSSIQLLSQENYGDRQLLSHYQEQLDSEETPDIELLVQLYKEAGVVLDTNIVKTLEQAKEFHRQIVNDRRSFLNAEFQSVTKEIEQRDMKIEAASNRRAFLLEILQTHGALSEFNKLTRRLEIMKERLNELALRRGLKAELNQKRLRINVLLAELRLDIQQDVSDNAKYIGTIQKIFGAYSKQLYGKWQHSLVVNSSKAGYDYKIDAADRKASEGIRHAGIFCYDATLASIWAKETYHPGFLFHDSSLFDPIEERQIEQILMAMSSPNTPYQYICTLNTDRLPSGHEKDVILRLTDRGTTGGLLGVRF